MKFAHFFMLQGSISVGVQNAQVHNNSDKTSVLYIYRKLAIDHITPTTCLVQTVVFINGVVGEISDID